MRVQTRDRQRRRCDGVDEADGDGGISVFGRIGQRVTSVIRVQTLFVSATRWIVVVDRRGGSERPRCSAEQSACVWQFLNEKRKAGRQLKWRSTGGELCCRTAARFLCTQNDGAAAVEHALGTSGDRRLWKCSLVVELVAQGLVEGGPVLCATRFREGKTRSRRVLNDCFPKQSYAPSNVVRKRNLQKVTANEEVRIFAHQLIIAV